jgi:ABC-type nickel/cobalt efflux system permease component RcnA
MAVTISVVTLMSLGGKKAFLKFFSQKPEITSKAVRFVEVVGASLIMLLGLMFLLPFLLSL